MVVAHLPRAPIDADIHLRRLALQTLVCVCSINRELAAAVACFGWQSNGVEYLGRDVLLAATDHGICIAAGALHDLTLTLSV